MTMIMKMLVMTIVMMTIIMMMTNIMNMIMMNRKLTILVMILMQMLRFIMIMRKKCGSYNSNCDDDNVYHMMIFYIEIWTIITIMRIDRVIKRKF